MKSRCKTISIFARYKFNTVDPRKYIYPINVMVDREQFNILSIASITINCYSNFYY